MGCSLLSSSNYIYIHARPIRKSLGPVLDKEAVAQSQKEGGNALQIQILLRCNSYIGMRGRIENGSELRRYAVVNGIICVRFSLSGLH